MLHTVIQKNNYQDSFNLMLLTSSINAIEGIEQGQVMMASDANKDILKSAGLYTDEVDAAGANDMGIVVEAEDEGVMEAVLAEIDRFLKDLSGKKVEVPMPNH